MAKQLILIHGSGNTSQDVWLPSVKNCFEKKGWQVITPNFLISEGEETIENWLAIADKNFSLTSETVLVGHSLGCPFIMSLLQRANIKVRKSILVAGLYDKTRFSEVDFLEEYDWTQISKNCEEFIFVHSTNDPWDCDEQEANFAFEKLGGIKVTMKDQGHFGTLTHNQPYSEFPFLTK